MGRHVDDTHLYPYVMTHLLTKFHNGHIDIQICNKKDTDTYILSDIPACFHVLPEIVCSLVSPNGKSAERVTVTKI